MAFIASQVRSLHYPILPAPNHSVTTSGPKRYDYDEERKAWFYKRDGVTLGELLEEEIRSHTGEVVSLGVDGLHPPV
jgi:hypothetical protein